MVTTMSAIHETLRDLNVRETTKSSIHEELRGLNLRGEDDVCDS